jgi:thiol:disulfide interchange protein DsbD
MRKARFFVWAGWLIAAMAGGAADTTTQVKLLLDAEVARPGTTVTAGLHLKMAPKWHTYWRNGGDSGGPTKIEWTLPPGVTAGEVQWPVPEKLISGPLVTYVYHDSVVLLVPLTLAANVGPGDLELKGKVSWMECEEICLKGKAEVSARLKIGAEAKPSAAAALIEAARKQLPPAATNLIARARWESADDGEKRPLVIEWELAEKPADADFFPYENEAFDVSNQTIRLPDAGSKVRLSKEVQKLAADWPTRISGLLVSRPTKGAAMQAYEVTLEVAPASAAAPGALPFGGSLIVMLGFAFLGGLILNIMPCVLPVIALKILGFVNQAKEAPERVRQLGLIYGAGVLVSFLVLAGLAIGVQQAGGLAGWGTAFQNPQFRVLITTLITLIALNLFGVFEVTLGGAALDAASGLTARSGSAGAFFNGMLATVLATPCTAPYLGGAISFAFTQPPGVIVLAFLTSGVGLALPFVVLCWQPAWLKFLPRPGAWMERFKVAMGFPMLATAVWLFWVTATRLGKSGVLWFGLFLVLLALAAWVWGEFVQRGSRRRGLATALSVLIAAGGYGYTLEHKLHWRAAPGSKAADAIPWQPWSPAAVAAARAEGRPVLVDFTADTCVNCQVNKATSLEIPATRAKLKEINAVTLIGDYTDDNPAIAQELRRFGRPGVPLVLVYPKDAARPPQVLPALLTPRIVLDALDEAVR